ncbi:hypothetical protein PHMEG_00038028 [Phytophthora megakarya]|uniref:Uncharacterized protein n=1 Tax=Phytophthora megakarya TaxID=4795 RepID=A0A225UIB9_9STRA|nr:hypothetical protein PHMEG_00038028 [Phytophthora megakarya]
MLLSPDTRRPNLGPERTPPARRSPRLAELPSAGASTDTPQTTSTTARVEPISEGRLAERRSPRLAQQRAQYGGCSSLGGIKTTDANLYRVILKPIVKQAVSQRDATGEELEIYAVEGSTFSVLIKKLWDKFRGHMKGGAVKVDSGEWSIVDLDVNDWAKMMQFKLPNRHLLDTERTEHQWNLWLSSVSVGNITQLYVYEYGSKIKTLPVLAAFKKACIDPVATDRAGAASEATLQEIADRIQHRWSSTFQGAAVLWRMWANDIVRNLNRSTWDAAIAPPPPEYVARLFRPAESRLELQIAGISRSANLALDCVNAAIAANSQLLQDWEMFRARIKENGKCLVTRKAVIQGFIDDVLPPQDVLDPMERMENIPDIDHA